MKKKIIIIITIIIVFILGIIIYNNVMLNKNTEDFEKYLISEGYTSNNNGIYSKEKIEDDYIIQYIFTKNTSVLSKNITYNNGNSILLTYDSKNIIESSIEHYGITKSGEYVSSIQDGTYNVKKDKFQCKMILDKGLGSKCSVLKKESKSFANEVNNLLLKSNTKAKYIKSE